MEMLHFNIPKNTFGLFISNAEQDDLWESLTEVAHLKRSLDASLSVKKIMDTWTLQMGYPVINVQRDYVANTITITQSRFLSAIPEKSKDNHDYKWWVPITFDLEGGHFNGTRNEYWLSPNADSLVIDLPEDSKEKALIVNVQQTGYYRVNYDLENWNKITKALKNDPKTIHRTNRGQIFNDVFSLAKVGQVPYKVALDATKYFYNEKDSIPWRSVLYGFRYIKRMFWRSPAYGLLKRYLEKEMRPVYRSLGYFKQHKSESIDDEELRTSVVEMMCDLGYDDCKKQSRQLFKDWMNSADPKAGNEIDANLRQNVYCEAIKQGDEKEWLFLWNQLKYASNANEKRSIMYGLSCTSEVWILQRYLSLTIDPTSEIRKQDGASVVSYIARNPLGRFLTWDWIRNDWVKISNYFDTAISSSVGKMIKSVAANFNTPYELKELEDFFEEHQNELGTARGTTLNVLESVRANVHWMENYYDDIADWLNKNVN